MVFTLKESNNNMKNAMLHISSQIEDDQQLTFISMTANIDGKLVQFDFDQLTKNETDQLVYFLGYSDLSNCE